MRRFSLALVVALTIAGLGVIASPSGAASQTVSTRLSSAHTPVGKPVLVLGRVTPKAPGQQVRLEQYSAGAWRASKVRKLTRNSTYTMAIAMDTPGRYRFRVATAHGVGKAFVVTVGGMGAAAGDPYNDRLAVQVGSEGRFNFGAFPDPATGGERADNSSFMLSYLWPEGPLTSFATVRVADDVADPVDTVLGCAGQAFTCASPVSPPVEAADHLSDSTGYSFDDIGVVQKLSVVHNPLSNLDDLGRIEYTITNDGSTSHDVGLRYMNDVDVANNDAAPFRVPNVGPVTTETDFTGDAIPTYFNVFNDLSDSSKVGVAILKGSGATTPDRVAIAAWGSVPSPGLYDGAWDYTVTPGRDTGDSAYADWWNPAPLAPGASRTYVTYYGLGDVTTVIGPDLGLGVVAPSSLALNSCAYDPNPFDVVATVVNSGTATSTGTTATITLPAGLSLAGGTASQSISDLAPGASAEVTWSVDAADQSSAQSLTFSVTAAATGADPATANRTVDVPAACSGPNHPPVANPQTVTTNENTPVGIVLTGSDPDGNPLTYAVASPPAHGTLSGVAPNLTYTPTAGYSGPDSLTFTVNDGTDESTPATVSITVSRTTNRPPVANPQSVSTPTNVSLPITLTGSDPDSDPLTFRIVSGPAHGTLSGTAPNLTYTPNRGYMANDSFTFVVNDGTVDSAPATVSISVICDQSP